MTITISAEGVVAVCTVIGLVAAAASFIVQREFNTRDAATAAVKAATKVLFEKLDATSADLQHYKLHVAETYVNQAALERLLAPIEKRLGAIEEDLRK